MTGPVVFRKRRTRNLQHCPQSRRRRHQCQTTTPRISAGVQCHNSLLLFLSSISLFLSGLGGGGWGHDFYSIHVFVVTSSVEFCWKSACRHCLHGHFVHGLFDLWSSDRSVTVQLWCVTNWDSAQLLAAALVSLSDSLHASFGNYFGEGHNVLQGKADWGGKIAFEQTCVCK